MSPHADSYLVQALVDNDTLAIQTIYARYAQQILRMVCQNNGTAEDARDVFQEALITITRQARNGMVLTCPFGAYLFMVCKGLWINELERRRRKKVTISDFGGFEEREDVFQLAEQTLRDAQRDELFHTCFEKLPESCRQILKMAWAGTPLEQVAGALKMQYSYVRKRKSECSSMLLKLVQESPGFDELT